MALYLVRKTHKQSMTRYTMYETEVEIADDADEDAVMKRMSAKQWGDSVDTWEEDDFGLYTGDEFEVIELLEVQQSQPQSKPEDFGFAQPSLLD
jgi:hypothetical protein